MNRKGVMMEFVECGWSIDEINEAVKLLNTGGTCFIFMGVPWEWRALRNAVECEIEKRIK